MRHLMLTGATLVLLFTSCKNESASNVDKDNITEQRKLEGEALIKRGQYLTTIGGCNDCHTPKKMTERGPVLDDTKILSGHPAGSPLPAVNASALQPGQWVNMSPDVTAFVGPWGISYAANLTSDSATGVGAWSKESFIKAMRTGKHLGMENGRPIMPPMPWEGVAQMTDEDLEAVFAFLKSLPAVNNRVPDPVPPAQVLQTSMKN
jgi:mono/diheme cytochrome c family protein